MPSNHIGSWQGNGTLNIGSWQGAGVVAPVAPFIITHPSDQNVLEGTLVTFTVVAGGTAPLSYQWYRNGILQIGETGTSYSFIAALTDDGDTVFCRVTNIAGTVDSNTATLGVFEATEIDDLEYYTREQPTKSEELVNRVVVTTQPLIAATATEELFKNSDEFTLNPSETRDFRFYYTKQPALETGATTSLFDTSGGTLNVDTETYYPWGVELTITNTDAVVSGSAKVLVEGFPLEVSGEETVIDEALPEIQQYGLQEYVYPNNHLIQSVDMAERVAEKLLAGYKVIRKDTSLVWRGNPALELGDNIMVPEYKRDAIEIMGTFKIIKNQIEYDGALKERTDARKV